MIRDVELGEWVALVVVAAALASYGYAVFIGEARLWINPWVGLAGGFAMLSATATGAGAIGELFDVDAPARSDPWYSFGTGVVVAATMLAPPMVAYLAAFVGTAIGAGLVGGIIINGIRREVTA